MEYQQENTTKPTKVTVQVKPPKIQEPIQKKERETTSSQQRICCIYCPVNAARKNPNREYKIFCNTCSLHFCESECAKEHFLWHGKYPCVECGKFDGFWNQDHCYTCGEKLCKKACIPNHYAKHCMQNLKHIEDAHQEWKRQWEKKYAEPMLKDVAVTKQDAQDLLSALEKFY